MRAQTSLEYERTSFHLGLYRTLEDNSDSSFDDVYEMEDTDEGVLLNNRAKQGDT